MTSSHLFLSRISPVSRQYTRYPSFVAELRSTMTTRRSPSLCNVRTSSSTAPEGNLKFAQINYLQHSSLLLKWNYYITTNNQTLGRAGDNDQRSKRFCSNAVLCLSLTLQIEKTRVIRWRRVEGRNARDQISFCAFHSFLVKIQTNALRMLATYMPRMRNINLKIRIAGSSCRLQLWKEF